MNADTRKALLTYIQSVPEWQTALINEQLAVLNRSAATLEKTNAQIIQGFVDSKLHPDKYFSIDRLSRRDWLTGNLMQCSTALGEAMAALELITALSDAHPQDFQHMAEYSCNLRYERLYELCVRHGYKEKT